MSPLEPRRVAGGVLLLALATCTGIIGDGIPEAEPDAGQVGTDLPCDVAAVLNARCVSCHGSPLAGVPLTLASYTDLSAPSLSDPSKSNAAVALERMADTARPMPPSAPVPGDDVAVMRAWVEAGLPPGDCGASNPYDTPLQCSSGRKWTHGNEESPHMHPGRACIACHDREGEGPHFALAGTVYPTAHEPDECYGADASATLRITDADGQEIDVRVTSSGNFFLEDARIVMPYTARLRHEGRERAMVTPQQDGDCNGCHTVDGENGAPGRLMLP